VVCFHAGTKINADGQLVTAGGRVFGVTAWGDGLVASVKKVYAAAVRVEFEGRQYRKDIARLAI
jgi:phosphoribosylamine-glycine ligase